MGAKSLTITEEAYELLAAHRRADESFSDTIVRLANADDDPLSDFGSWADSGLGDAVAHDRE